MASCCCGGLPVEITATTRLPRFTGNEVADPLPWRGGKGHALVETRVSAIGYGQLSGPRYLGGDIDVVQIVAQADDIGGGLQGRPGNQFPVAVHGTHVGAHDFDGVGWLIDEGQGQAAEDSRLDDLSGDRFQDHLQFQRRQDEMPDGAEGGQKLL